MPSYLSLNSCTWLSPMSVMPAAIARFMSSTVCVFTAATSVTFSPKGLSSISASSFFTFSSII